MSDDEQAADKELPFLTFHNAQVPYWKKGTLDSRNGNLNIFDVEYISKTYGVAKYLELCDPARIRQTDKEKSR